MNKKELAFLETMLPRIRAYKKPSHEQQQIIALCRINQRTEIQDKQLTTLVQVQIKAQELRDARRKASAIDKEKKDIERKKETRRKIVWGSALKTASENDPQIKQLMRRLFNDGYISDKDKELVQSDIKQT